MKTNEPCHLRVMTFAICMGLLSLLKNHCPPHLQGFKKWVDCQKDVAKGY